MKEINPNDLNLVELKALAYDLLVEKENVERNLQMVTRVINTKSKPVQPQPQPVVSQELQPTE